MHVADGRTGGGAHGRWTGQDGAVDPLVRKGLEPRRLASGAVFGVVIGVLSALLVGSEGHKSIYYVGIALAIALVAPWILSVLYLRTERGRAAREESLTRREQPHGCNGEKPDWPR
jgi:peptidoglycan/LPS O-acetylase OafA/YrhL